MLLTPRGNLGGRSLWYTLDTTNDRIAVKVSSAVAADLEVGWLLMGDARRGPRAPDAGSAGTSSAERGG